MIYTDTCLDQGHYMVLLCLYRVAIVVLFSTQFESGQSESPSKSYDRLNIHRFNSKKKGICFLGRAVVNANFIPPLLTHSRKSFNRLFTPLYATSLSFQLCNRIVQLVSALLNYFGCKVLPV